MKLLGGGTLVHGCQYVNAETVLTNTMTEKEGPTYIEEDLKQFCIVEGVDEAEGTVTVSYVTETEEGDWMRVPGPMRIIDWASDGGQFIIHNRNEEKTEVPRLNRDELE